MSDPIRLAIIGAGIFARDDHLPTIKALNDRFEVVAVCSRREESAAELAAMIPNKPDVYIDISAVLSRSDVEAVDIILPIAIMADVAEMALKAGKHVISEKPISPDVAIGQRVLSARNDKVWFVAENWRYLDMLTQAAEVIKSGEIGRPLLCNWAQYVPMDAQNKYYHTAWRRDNSFPGGFLMDGGVHHMAALRMLLGEIASVTAVATLMRADLPPADTISAALRFESGTVGSYSITFAAGAPWETMIHIAGEKGSIRVDPGHLEVTIDGHTRRSTGNYGDSMAGEFKDFAAAVREGTTYRATAEQALQDVAIIEALLKSAQSGCSVKPERVV